MFFLLLLFLHYYTAWLQLHNTGEKKSLISSLQSVLEVVNGTHPSLRGDPYSPGAVIKALNNLGWMIPADEHDPHELLHVMLSSLEEELTKPKKVKIYIFFLRFTKILIIRVSFPAGVPFGCFGRTFDYASTAPK
jgi:hypothetical protein